MEAGIISTAEAAGMVGVVPATVRWWVGQGYLEPVRRGAKPLQFRDVDVWRCARDRIAPAEAARLDALWVQIRAED